MALSYNAWQGPGPGADTLIFVNGTSGTGKIFCARVGKSVQVRCKGASHGDLAPIRAEIIADLKSRGISDLLATHLDWDALCSVATPPRGAGAQTTPATKPAAPIVSAGMQGRERSNLIDPHPRLDITTIKVPDPIHIRVDHREPQQIIDLLRTAANTEVTVEALPLGDFVLNDRLIVERKTTADFESSILDGRLFDQAHRLALHPDAKGVILIEGDVFAESQRLLPQNLIGALSCLSIVQSLSVWNSRSFRDTAYTLVKLATHERSGLGYQLALRQEKPSTLLSQRRYVLEGLPGISANLAEALLVHFGSIRAVANATPADLQKVPGIGAKRATEIHRVISGAVGD